MNNIEESIKIAKDVKFAVLGRAIADSASSPQGLAPLLREVTLLRRQEHEVTDKEVAFAGIARQIGDANRNGKDLAQLIARIVQLRRLEVTGRP